jgi:hypothetical protein
MECGERGDGGVFMGWLGLGEGLGFREVGSASDGSGEAVLVPVSLEMTTDRWASPVSILNVAAAYRFSSGC